MILQNDRLRVGVSPHYGGRVTSLIDLSSGRDWMAPGGESDQVGEDAAYLGDEGVGWDECFPTVSPWDASATVWGRRLRDHGDIWGRTMEVVEESDDRVTLARTTDEYRFARTLTLSGATLVCDYAVENGLAEPLPFLWALHALLTTHAGENIVMPGISQMSATHVGKGTQSLPITSVDWPRGDPAIGFPLDIVQPASAFSAKLYAPMPAKAHARVGGARGWLTLDWDAEQVGHVGVWMNYGNWPEPGDLHHLAIEPTTGSTDHLGDALSRGEAVIVPPGGRVEWTVRVTVATDAEMGQ